MMAQLSREVELRAACDDSSRWSVSFTRTQTGVFIGLHHGDKYYAAHSLTLTHEQWAQIAAEMKGSE